MKAYKIETVEKMRALLKLKEEAERTDDAAGIHHGVVVARYTADSAPDMPGSVVVVPGEPQVERIIPPMPERLKHLTFGEIKLMFEDNELLPDERRWFNSRKMPDYSTWSPWHWMTL